ncbi:hypothetical protein D0T49_03055 [Paludibacter sp. 221]|nr:hypothetical protein [Paludibacter sp. 221]
MRLHVLCIIMKFNLFNLGIVLLLAHHLLLLLFLVISFIILLTQNNPMDIHSYPIGTVVKYGRKHYRIVEKRDNCTITRLLQPYLIESDELPCIFLKPRINHLIAA